MHLSTTENENSTTELELGNNQLRSRVHRLCSVLPHALMITLCTCCCVRLYICLHVYVLARFCKWERPCIFLSDTMWPHLLVYILISSVILRILWLHFSLLNNIHVCIHQCFINHAFTTHLFLPPCSSGYSSSKHGCRKSSVAGFGVVLYSALMILSAGLH